MTTAPSQEFLKSATYIVDASSYIFRAYYAIRAGLTAADGTPTHATLGFLQMVQSLVDKHHPKRLIFVWDRPEKGERHTIFKEYKANRNAPPEDLGLQIANVKEALKDLGYPGLECKGYEADDCIATLVRKNPDAPIVIVTSDKDLLQLVDGHVICLDTMKEKWSGKPEAHEKFGVEPHQIRDVQALSGDTVDNIPGAPGIGPKTATDLVTFYGSLDKIIELAEERYKKGITTGDSKEDPLKGKRIEAIGAHVDLVRTSLRLVSLLEAPIDTELSKYDFGPQNVEGLRTLYTRLGFVRLLDRLKNAATAEAAESVERVESPSITIESTARDFTTHLIESTSQLNDLLSQAEKAPFVVMDTETKSLCSIDKENLVGLSFAFGEDRGFYVPLRHKETHLNLDIRAVLDRFQTFLNARAEARQPVVFHNAKFDLHVLKSESIKLAENLEVHDSMIESFVLDPNQRHGMDDLSVKFLKGYRCQSFDEVLGDAEDFSCVTPAAASFYSSEDAVVTLKLFSELSSRLKKSEQLWRVYNELDRPLIRVLADIEEAGVCVDARRLKQYSGDLHAELLKMEKEALQDLKKSGVDVPEDFNMGSTKQLAQILYEKLQLPVLKRNKTGPSTDASVLEELSEQHPFPKKLLEIRELSKLLSTYVDALPDLIRSDTHRVHTDFSQTIAATGRLSSTNPNLQNIPIRTERGRKIRESFVAEEGMSLVGVDYSQIELRILAEITQDKELVRAFQEGADIHRRTAALILRKSESSITEDDRRMAKTINFGIIYGQTAFGLSKQLRIPKGAAQQFIDDYNKSYPGISQYAKEVIEKARSSGRVQTLIGRQRFLPDIKSKNFPMRQFAERVAINTPIQGTAADLMKAAMLRVHHELKKISSARLILQVHDELLVECPSSQIADVQRIVVQSMEDTQLLAPFGLKPFKVPMKAEASSGKHWGEL